MAATGTPTTNIGLRRPQGTDPASVDDINYNSGVIDTKMGAVGNTSLQAQVNALNSKLGNLKFFATSVASNGSKTLTIANDTRAIIYTVGGSQNVMDCISINSTSGGVVAYKSMNEPSGQTVSTSTNALTITNTNAVGTGIYVLIFTGSIS